MSDPIPGSTYRCAPINDGDYLYIWNGWSDGKTQFRNESMSGLTFKAMKNANDPKIRARADFYLHRTRRGTLQPQRGPRLPRELCLMNLMHRTMPVESAP
jgi:hypothetical protein